MTDPSTMGKKGGDARAKSLSKSERSAIARQAAESRWTKEGKSPALRAIREAPLVIGGTEFECAVLDNEVRVLSERAFARAIGSKRGGRHWQRKKRDPGGAHLPVFLSAQYLKPFISKDLAEALSEPLEYIPKQGATVAYGIRAELIPQVLDVYLKARSAGILNERQRLFAQIAETVLAGLATTGIVALIDEATGYQELRSRDALAKILEAYVAKELRRWIPTFPTSFFKELCRLKGIAFREDMRLPPYFGHLVNDLVYSRLAPGVLDELRRVNPIDPAAGRRKRKHFQWLTENVGNPHLLHHLGMLEGLARGHHDWDAYYAQVDKTLPKYIPMPLFDQPKE